jgi:hypothetical protein
MLLNTAATVSPTWSPVCTALAEVRTPTRSNRFSIDRKRRSIIHRIVTKSSPSAKRPSIFRCADCAATVIFGTAAVGGCSRDEEIASACRNFPQLDPAQESPFE